MKRNEVHDTYNNYILRGLTRRGFSHLLSLVKLSSVNSEVCPVLMLNTYYNIMVIFNALLGLQFLSSKMFELSNY